MSSTQIPIKARFFPPDNALPPKFFAYLDPKRRVPSLNVILIGPVMGGVYYTSFRAMRGEPIGWTRPLAIWLAYRKGLVDVPRPQRTLGLGVLIAAVAMSSMAYADTSESGMIHAQ